MTATIEQTAWCLWAADRRSVSEVTARPARIGVLDYDAYFAVAHNGFELKTTDPGHGGAIAVYGSDADPVREATDDGRAGRLSFDVDLVLQDPEVGAFPVAQPRYSGLFSWSCGDAPPAR